MTTSPGLKSWTRLQASSEGVEYQLRNRLHLKTDKTAFDSAWTEEWLRHLRTQHPVRLQRVLVPISRSDAELLLAGRSPQEGRSQEIAHLILSHPIFATYPVY